MLAVELGEWWSAEPWQHLAEFIALALLVGVAGWRAGVRQGWPQLSVGHRAVVVLVAGALLLAQYTRVPNTYPFIAWTLYSAPTSSHEFYRATVEVDGVVVGDLPLADLAVTKSPRAHLRSLGGLASRAAGGDEAAQRTLQAVLSDWSGRFGAGATVTFASCSVDRPTAARPEQCTPIIVMAFESGAGG